MLLKRPRGVALIAALLVLLILVIVAASFVRVMARDVRTSRMSGDALIAFYTAEAGLEYARWLHKHNIAVYPTANVTNPDGSGTILAGSVYNIPLAKGDNTSFQGVTDSTAAGINDPSASEHVFINDMAFYDDTDLFGTRRYCSTFQLREISVLTADPNDGFGARAKVVVISTGRVRQVPNNWVWESDSVEDGVYTGKALEDNGFTEVYKRTVLSELRVSSLSESVSSNNSAKDLKPATATDRNRDGSGFWWHEWAR